MKKKRGAPKYKQGAKGVVRKFDRKLSESQRECAIGKTLEDRAHVSDTNLRRWTRSFNMGWLR